MIGINLNNVEPATEFARPKPGGYVMQIVSVDNNKDKQRLELGFEFAEGQFAGYCKETKERAGFWPATANKPYTERAKPFFRQFIDCVLESNDNTEGLVIGNFEDIDETKLVGMKIGAIVGDREYAGNDGVKKTGLDWYRARFVPVQKVRDGDYSTPEKRIETNVASVTDGSVTRPPVTDGRAKTNNEPAFAPVKDDDIPF